MKEPLQLILKRGVKRWLRRRHWAVRRARWNYELERRIQGINDAAVRHFKALQGKTGLKVHLGCGPDIRPEWVNIDLNPSRSGRAFEQRPDGTVYLNYDLRQGLPHLGSETCVIFYSSHFFEHLEYEVGVKLIEDCFRALQPGGVFRIALPDMKSLFAAYLKGDTEFFRPLDPLLAPEIEPKTATPIDYINYGIYQFGEHKYIYDQDKLLTVLKSLGFGNGKVASFDPAVDVDTPTRRKYSFYVEATKPAS